MSDTEQTTDLRALIEAAFDNRELLEDKNYSDAVETAIAMLDQGVLRVAKQDQYGDWSVNAWVKQAILLYFAVRGMERVEVGAYEYHDKIPLKKNLDKAGVRVVPPGTVRYGAHMERGSILMPGYVNIGARVGEGTMVDTWATVGSCAQIGKNVHLSGGVGIGGVLEPPGANPVIIEDGAFLGSRSIVVEGCRVGKEAVLGAGVIITASTKIVDVTGDTPIETPTFCASAFGGDPGYADQDLPGWRLPGSGRADHRPA